MTNSERPDWLAEHLERLPAERAPDRDLWPGIALRLDRRERSRWQIPAMAACVLLSVGLALFGWQALRAAQAERLAAEATMAQLLEPYERTQDAQAARWFAARAVLHPTAVETLEAEMNTLQAARESLSNALANAPTDPTLHRLLRQVLARQSELIDAGERLGPQPI
jgi:hypothetical protein